MRRLSTLLVIILSMFIPTTVFAGNTENKEPTVVEVKSFSDVKTTDWFYKDVMYAAQHGIMSGTTTPVNGVGTFQPAREITIAEFLKVSVYAISDVSKIPDSPKGAEWWTGVYNYALDQGIIKEAEMSRDIMNKDSVNLL